MKYPNAFTRSLTLVLAVSLVLPPFSGAMDSAEKCRNVLGNQKTGSVGDDLESAENFIEEIDAIHTQSATTPVAGSPLLSALELDELAKTREALREVIKTGRRPVFSYFKSPIHKKDILGNRPVVFGPLNLDDFYPVFLHFLEDLDMAMSRPIDQNVIDFGAARVSNESQRDFIQKMIRFFRTPPRQTDEVSPGAVWFANAMTAEWPQVTKRTSVASIFTKLVARFPVTSGPAKNAVLASLQTLEKTVNETGFKNFVARNVAFVRKRSKIFMFGLVTTVLFWGPLYLWTQAHPSFAIFTKHSKSQISPPAIENQVAHPTTANTIVHQLDPWLKELDAENLKYNAGRAQDWNDTNSASTLMSSSLKGYSNLGASLQGILSLDQTLSAEARQRLTKVSQEEAHILLTGASAEYQAALSSGTEAQVRSARAQYWGVVADEMIIGSLLQQDSSAQEALQQIKSDLKTPEDFSTFINIFYIHALQIRVEFSSLSNDLMTQPAPSSAER